MGDDDMKQRVRQAVAQARKATIGNSGKTTPKAHYIPGKIFWIEGAPPSLATTTTLGPGVGGESSMAAALSAPPVLGPSSGATERLQLHVTDAMAFQEMLIRGGQALGTDHKTGNYMRALETLELRRRSELGGGPYSS